MPLSKLDAIEPALSETKKFIESQNEWTQRGIKILSIW